LVDCARKISDAYSELLVTGQAVRRESVWLKLCARPAPDSPEAKLKGELAQVVMRSVMSSVARNT